MDTSSRVANAKARGKRVREMELNRTVRQAVEAIYNNPSDQTEPDRYTVDQIIRLRNAADEWLRRAKNIPIEYVEVGAR